MPVFGCLNVIENRLTQKFLMATRIKFLKSLHNLEQLCTFIYSSTFKSQKNQEQRQVYYIFSIQRSPLQYFTKKPNRKPTKKNISTKTQNNFEKNSLSQKRLKFPTRKFGSHDSSIPSSQRLTLTGEFCTNYTRIFRNVKFH